ncbi:MAG: hypothetical protein IH899_06695 [Planctomycetes bacterium]|nr:hypothetical protein [Planctomycetota bacterium]
MSSVLETEQVQALFTMVEEAERSAEEGVKRFIEPAQGTLNRATSKRPHIVFGRRGSGKSSLLRKAGADLTVDRRPIAYVNLETFKGHSYPDILLSVLIATFREFKNWLDTAAINPANKKQFWNVFFGTTPTRPSYNRKKAAALSTKLQTQVDNLEKQLHAADESDLTVTSSSKHESVQTGGLSASVNAPHASVSAESGISLESLDDSGISLAADDSGLSILDADSGLTLEADDSGISVEADSGISLDKAGTEELDKTAPMVGSPSLSDGDDDDTELEIPTLEADDDSEFELQLDDTERDSSAGSSVLLFEDEADPDEHSATVVKKAGGEGLLDEAEGETFDLSEGDSDAFDLEEDEFDVTDDVLGEDDELDELDVFDADDDVFDESLDTGESHAEFVAPRGVGRVEAAVEAEWGGLTFAGLLVSTGLMALCTMLMFDLVRSMWAWNEPSTFSSGLLEALSGLFD